MDQRSHNALSHHGVGDLQEAGNVRAEHHVARLAALDGGVVAGLKDALHDAVQLLVDFFEAPAHAQGVLAHFQTGGGNAAGVGSLARRVEQAGLDDRVDGLGGQRHVRAFEHGHGAVFDDGLRALEIHLVLGRARHGDVARHGPDVLAALVVLAAGHFVGVDADAGAALLLDVKQHVEVDAVGIVDVALGVAHGDDLAAELGALLRAVLRHVAGAGHDDLLALEAVVSQVLEHFGGEVADAVAGGLGAGERAAVGQALAGDDAALKAVDDLLVLAVHIADLARADADVAGRGVSELADVAIELGHEALAETHDLTVGLAVGVKVGAALAAAHGQGGQGVLQDLLEAKELDDGQVDRGMEAQTALVGADRGVELHTVAAVDLDLAVVVHPGNAEDDDALGLNEALHEAGFFPLGVLVDDVLEALKDFVNGLQELGLVGVVLLKVGENAVQICIVDHFLTSFLLFTLLSKTA